MRSVGSGHSKKGLSPEQVPGNQNTEICLHPSCGHCTGPWGSVASLWALVITVLSMGPLPASPEVLSAHLTGTEDFRLSLPWVMTIG